MVVGCQPYAPTAFTPRNIPGIHFHYGLSRPQGHGLVERKYVTVTTPGIDPGTVRLVAQRLNHYTTPDPGHNSTIRKYLACVISGFRRGENEIFALLGCYTGCNDS